MTYDCKVPLALKSAQQWFASIIARPIDTDSLMNPISPTGNRMEEEACRYIVPSPTLRPAQRIQIYNQQYWWRLLGIMHETYPLVMRMFGYHAFNQELAIPYLDKYPSIDWTLSTLGDRFVLWLEEEYKEVDRLLVLDAAKLDLAFNSSFFVAHHPLVSPDAESLQGGMESLFEQQLSLQSHLHLFALEYDLFYFRAEFLKEEPEYWSTHEFPLLPREKEYFFVLYRDVRNATIIEEVGLHEYRLLQLFAKGTSIESACEWLEQQDKALFDEASLKLHVWFESWIARQWLCSLQICDHNV